MPRLDVPLFKALLGLLLVVMCPLLFFSARLPRIRRGGRFGNALAGAAGGAMARRGGFTGVAPTLWCTLRGFDRDVQRVVIQNFNLAMLAVAFTTYLVNGTVTREMVAPAILIPSLLGARLYAAISETGFRQIVLGLLTASGVALLTAALPVLARRS